MFMPQRGRSVINRPQQQQQSGGLMPQIMSALGQYGQNAQSDLDARHRQAVFEANPDYAAKIYGAPTSQYQQQTMDMARRQEQQQQMQRSALARLAGQIGGGVPQNGEMGPMQVTPGESALAKIGAITGDPSDLAKLIIARERGSSPESGGATGVLVDRLMKETGMPFADALAQIQTGYRSGVNFQNGAAVPIPGLGAAKGSLGQQENYGKETGTLNAKLALEPQITAANKAAELESVAASDLLKKAKNAQSSMDILQKAEELLPKATGSLAGAGRDILKGAVGISDEKTQANTDLELLSGWLVSNVPRMEGPQSNFDVENYRKMAADLGNSKKPIGDRQAALSTLMSLQAKYADLNKEVAPSAQGGTRKKFNPATRRLE